MSDLITDINAMSQPEFVALLGAVFEETPAIAQQAYAAKPFASISELHQAMVAVVEEMPRSQQIALIQAHPELATKAKMAEASVQEQKGAGLDQLSPLEHERFQTLNSAYRKKFDFPFVIAVKGHDKDSILAALEGRLRNEREREVGRSLAEITKIARFRLEALSGNMSRNMSQMSQNIDNIDGNL
ncbi:MAG: 2-oxo-4-hydroxy-4-carboxy-5-ureidoimidazoline decarboxylase [Phormidesmis sp.]